VACLLYVTDISSRQGPPLLVMLLVNKQENRSQASHRLRLCTDNSVIFHNNQRTGVIQGGPVNMLECVSIKLVLSNLRITHVGLIPHNECKDIVFTVGLHILPMTPCESKLDTTKINKRNKILNV